MRGIGSKPIEYVCTRDRNEPEEYQTIFELIPRNHERANESSAIYSRVMQDAVGDMADAMKMNKADREAFIGYCKRVRNYAFSDDFYERHPNIRDLANEEGFIDVIDTPELLAEVARDMANSDLMELANAVNDPVELMKGARKREA